MPDSAAAAPAIDSAWPLEFSLLEATRRLGGTTAAAAAWIWEQVWAMRLSHQGFDVVRRGLAHGFVATEPDAERAARSSPRRERWQAARPFAGLWRQLVWPERETDPLDLDASARERARLLLARYGFVCRELVSREEGAWRWCEVGRALRLLELSGEVVSGCFFAGLSRQFATPQWLARCEQLARDWEPVFAVAAFDPASMVGLPGLTQPLPRRGLGAWVSYAGARPLLVVERDGQRLHFLVAPDDAALSQALAPLRLLLSRSVAPCSSIKLDVINDEPAIKSRYRTALERHFFLSGGPRHLYLESVR